jgi:hypothetical protein
MRIATMLGWPRLVPPSSKAIQAAGVIKLRSKEVELAIKQAHSRANMGTLEVSREIYGGLGGWYVRLLVRKPFPKTSLVDLGNNYRANVVPFINPREEADFEIDLRANQFGGPESKVFKEADVIHRIRFVVDPDEQPARGTNPHNPNSYLRVAEWS